MTLRDYAVLEVTQGETTAAFEFADGFEDSRTITHNPLVDNRGQYIQKVWDLIPGDFDPPGIDESIPTQRVGVTLDGGAGEKARELTFTTGMEPDADLSWGDGSGGTGPENVTLTDASGPNVSQYDKQDVFERWMAEAPTDSVRPGRLYYNQWSDGTYAESAGLYGRPMPVSVVEATASTDLDEPTAISGTVQVKQVNVLTERAQTLTEDVANGLAEHLDFG